ncbi:acyltransferase [Phytobacter sp. AG2a]
MSNDVFDVYRDNNNIDIHSPDGIGANVKVNIKGHDHTIIIEEGVQLRNFSIVISGERNTLHIKKNSNMRGGVHIRHTGSKIIIEKDFTAVNVTMFALEGKSIIIGEDCMFSSGVILRTSDEHPIFDILTEERINFAKDIIIGKHVWVGEGVTLNKATNIPDGCIIGATSFVSKKLNRPSAAYAGTPAKLVRENVLWKRKL